MDEGNEYPYESSESKMKEFGLVSNRYRNLDLDDSCRVAPEALGKTSLPQLHWQPPLALGFNVLRLRPGEAAIMAAEACGKVSHLVDKTNQTGNEGKGCDKT